MQITPLLSTQHTLKVFVNFLLGTTLSFLNLVSCVGINGFYVLLCFIIDHIQFGLELLNRLTFSLSKLGI
jgi:hypothetical protein